MRRGVAGRRHRNKEGGSRCQGRIASVTARLLVRPLFSSVLLWPSALSGRKRSSGGLLRKERVSLSAAGGTSLGPGLAFPARKLLRSVLRPVLAHGGVPRGAAPAPA